MNLQMHPAYEQLIEKANNSHRNNRSPAGITDADVCLARLHCYAFRAHTIGTFHATRLAIENRTTAGQRVTAYRRRAVETLEDMANLAMDSVPVDFRALISTLYRYHNGVERVIESTAGDAAESRDGEIERIGVRFRRIIEQITTSGGICLTRDTEATEQASFVVPNLGITIVPLVYGDHHSWNLAYLSDDSRNVPLHRHHEGVEIHLGYHPTHGMTVLDDHRTPVDEGYAMPIPAETNHGWVNTGHETHHVPFLFGSLKHAGWGVFLDVEAVSRPVDELKLVDRECNPFHEMIYLEREIARAEALTSSQRSTLIPHSVTDRDGSGGLELGLTRITDEGYTFPNDSFRIVSVVRGQGFVSIEGIERAIREHDHFGIPADMAATLKQTADPPLVVLDAQIKGSQVERRR